jgi:hypothetical protein
MSEQEPNRAEDLPAPGPSGGGEEIDALPVLAKEATILQARALPGTPLAERRSAGVMIPSVQAAAMAAGGFVAGAAVVGFVHRRQRRASAIAKGGAFGRELARGGRGARRGGRAAELVQIVGSRSLLVDVHLLGGTGANS